jgi:hypothetical protein
MKTLPTKRSRGGQSPPIGPNQQCVHKKSSSSNQQRNPNRCKLNPREPHQLCQLKNKNPFKEDRQLSLNKRRRKARTMKRTGMRSRDRTGKRQVKTMVKKKKRRRRRTRTEQR